MVNGLFYNETYISNLFHSTQKETFFSFMSRSVGRIVYTTIVSAVIEFFMDCFFPEEESLRSIIINSKGSTRTLNAGLDRFYKRTRKNYIIFISLSYVVTLFSWYYLTCFCNAYPNTKYEWIKSSVFITILMQLFVIIKCYLYAVLRIIGIICKFERVFKFSKKFS